MFNWVRALIAKVKGDSLTWGDWYAEKRKLVAYFAGVAAQLLNLGLVPDKFVPHVAAAIAFLTAVGIYQATNQQPVPFAEPAFDGDQDDEEAVVEDGD